MAELRDDYLDYLNTSGLLDEDRWQQPEPESRSKRPSSSARERRPGERLPSWGGGDVDEPLISPGDLYGPIASKLGKETADLLVPYLMKSVSRMAPMLSEAQRALRRGGSEAPVPFEPRAEALFTKIDDILAHVRENFNARRSVLGDISEAERQAIRDKVAEEFGVRRARQAAEDETYLAGRKAEIDAASRKRADEWQARQPAEDLEPSSQRRVVDYDAPTTQPTGEAKQYEDIIRQLFEAGGQ